MCKEQVNHPQPPSRPWADAGCDVHVIDGATIREWCGGIVVNGINVIARETLETPADGAPVGSREIDVDGGTLTVGEAYQLAAAIVLEAAALAKGTPSPTQGQIDHMAEKIKAVIA